MSSAVSGKIQRLLKKTSDIDKDERFMAVSDICNELQTLEEAVAGLAARAASNAAAAAGAAGAAAAGQEYQITGRDLGLDAATQSAIGRTILGLLEDASSDVQTVAVKCLSLLCRRMSAEQLLPIVDKLSALVCDPSKQDSRDIYAIGLKTMTGSVAVGAGAGAAGAVPTAGGASAAAAAAPVAASPSSTGVIMAQRILVGMLSGLDSASLQQSAAASDPAAVDVVTTALDIIKEVLLKWAAHLADMHGPLLACVTPRLESGEDSVRKRSIATLAALVPFLSDAPFKQFMDTIVAQLARHESAAAAGAGQGGAPGGAQPMMQHKKQESTLLYTYIQMIGVVSTTAGSRIGRYLGLIVPQLSRFLALPTGSGSEGAELLRVLELCEYALAAFESLIGSCPQEFAPFLPAVLRAAQDIMSYDPNYIYADTEAADDDEAMGAAGGAGEQAEKPKAAAAADGDDEDWGATDDGWGEEGGDDAGGSAAPMDEVDEDESDDSNTWKVRRAAVKVISAFIRSNSVLQPAASAAAAAAAPAAAASAAGAAAAPASAAAASAEPVDLLRLNYSSLCDALLDRFKERDQNVKIVVLQAVEDLLRESAPTTAVLGSAVSEAQAHTPLSVSPSHYASHAFHFHQGVSSLLEAKVAAIVNACLRLLRKTAASSSANALETKHHVFLILTELLRVRQGGIEAFLARLMPLLIAPLLSPTTHQGLKIDAISLLRACIDSHSPQDWFAGSNAPFAAAQVQDISSMLTQSIANTPYIKYRAEALQTAGSFISLLGATKLQSASAAAAVIPPALLSQLYDLVSSMLQLNDVDQSIKEAVLQALSQLFFYFGAEVQSQAKAQAAGADRLRDCLAIVLQQRLFNELTRLASLRCITRIALAPAESGLDVSTYVIGSGGAAAGAPSRVLDELISFLKKDQQVLQLETIHTLLAVLANMEATQARGQPVAAWSPAQLSQLLAAATPRVSDEDLNLANSVLQLLQHLFRLCPALTVHASTPQAVEDLDAIVARLLSFLRSPLLQPQNLMHVRSLFHAMMQLTSGRAAAAINPRASFAFLFSTFVRSLTPLPASAPLQQQQAVQANIASPTYLANAAQMVGSGLLLHISPAEQSPVLAQLVATVQSNDDGIQKQFSLLILGELGRHVYLTPLHAAITEALFFACFNSDSESLRNCASTSWGNVILGNLTVYLPTLIQRMQAPSTNKQTMLLLLQSLRELITHVAHGEHPVGAQGQPSPVQSFRTFIPTLLPLLWAHADDSEESVRSLTGEVLGGLAIIDSSAAFTAMAALVASPKPHTRSVVITALRHALTQQQQHAQAFAAHPHAHVPALDHDLLVQHLPAFLQLLRDSDLSVRRQAILTVNALAHSRRGLELLSGSFHSIVLPTLFKHLVPDASLVRLVDLGPFKHKIDDGFPLRKAAYQTLDTLMDVAWPLLDAGATIRHLSEHGLADHDDVVISVYGILGKLAVTHPVELARVLDSMPQKMMDGIKEKLKVVKNAAAAADPASGAAASAPASGSGGGDQSSGERAKDVLRAAMRSMYAIQSMSTVHSCPLFIDLWQRVLKTQLCARILEEIKMTS